MKNLLLIITLSLVAMACKKEKTCDCRTRTTTESYTFAPTGQMIPVTSTTYSDYTKQPCSNEGKKNMNTIIECK